MESITEFFKEEKDPLFQKGLEKGDEKFVTYLLQELGLSDKQAADTAKVSVEFVKKIRKKLQK